jgi:hypothetical protein
MTRKTQAYLLTFIFIAGLFMNNPAMAFCPRNSSSKFSSETFTVSASMGSNGGSFNAGYNESDSVSNYTTYNNGLSLANNGAINYDVGGDMTVSGYNAQARDMNANVEGALRIESLQDTYYQRGSSFGVNAGAGYGSGKSGSPANKNASAGFSIGGDYADMAWVSNQTSLIGTNGVNIKAEEVNLKGSVIANITEEGIDEGNLLIETNAFNYSDIKDINVSESSGFGLQVNVSSGKSRQDKDMIGGTTSINFKSEGSESEQATRATVGQGNIVVKGTEIEPEDLNREIANSQNITKDQITGALDAGLTIDNRLLSEAGREEIAGDIKNFGKNMLTAGKGAIDGTKNMAKAANEVAKTIVAGINDELTDKGVIGTSKDKISIMQTEREFALAAKGIRAEMESKGYGEEQILAALNEAKVEIAKKYGVSGDEYQGLLAADAIDNRAGASFGNTGVVNVERVEGVLTDEQYAHVSTHEMVHAAGGSEEYAIEMGNFAAGMSGSSLTIMDVGHVMSGSGYEGNSWVFSEGNEFLANNPASITHNLIDGPNSGVILGKDGQVKPNEILHSPEGMQAQNQVLLIGGGIAGSILCPECALVASTGLTGFSLGNDLNTIFTADRQYGAFMNADGTATSYGEMAFNMAGKGLMLGLNFLGASLMSGVGNISKVTGPDGKYYSVAYQTEITNYPGTNWQQFKAANQNLNNAIQSNPDLANMMNNLNIKVSVSNAGTTQGIPPTGWVWHHAQDIGVMQLVPKSQHPNIPGGIFWNTLHPGGKGGMSIWGSK